MEYEDEPKEQACHVRYLLAPQLMKQTHSACLRDVRQHATLPEFCFCALLSPRFCKCWQTPSANPVPWGTTYRCEASIRCLRCLRGEMHGVGASDGGICFGLPRRSGRRVAAMPLRSTCVFAGSVAGGEGAVLDCERLKRRCACDVLYLGCPSCVRRGTVSPLQTSSVIPCVVSGDAESGFGHRPCLGHDSGEVVRCLHSILRSSPFGHSIWPLGAVICLMSRRAVCRTVVDRLFRGSTQIPRACHSDGARAQSAPLADWFGAEFWCRSWVALRFPQAALVFG